MKILPAVYFIQAMLYKAHYLAVLIVVIHFLCLFSIYVTWHYHSVLGFQENVVELGLFYQLNLNASSSISTPSVTKSYS